MKRFWRYVGLAIEFPLDYWMFLGVITFIIWMGLIGLFMAYTEVGAKESLDFIWQLILFSFALVAATVAIPQSLSEEQAKRLPLLIFCFVLAGGCFLSGFGLITMGITGKSVVLQKSGSILFGMATLPLSLGIAVVVMESFRKVFSVFSKKSQ